jgi:hypothetical protein
MSFLKTEIVDSLRMQLSNVEFSYGNFPYRAVAGLARYE